jgi:hypothetical protein
MLEQAPTEDLNLRYIHFRESVSALPEVAELNNPEQTLPLLRSKVGQFSGLISFQKSDMIKPEMIG